MSTLPPRATATDLGGDPREVGAHQVTWHELVPGAGYTVFQVRDFETDEAAEQYAASLRDGRHPWVTGLVVYHFTPAESTP